MMDNYNIVSLIFISLIIILVVSIITILIVYWLRTRKRRISVPEDIRSEQRITTGDRVQPEEEPALYVEMPDSGKDILVGEPVSPPDERSRLVEEVRDLFSELSEVTQLVEGFSERLLIECQEISQKLVAMENDVQGYIRGTRLINELNQRNSSISLSEQETKKKEAAIRMVSASLTEKEANFLEIIEGIELEESNVREGLKEVEAGRTDMDELISTMVDSQHHLAYEYGFDAKDRQHDIDQGQSIHEEIEDQNQVIEKIIKNIDDRRELIRSTMLDIEKKKYDLLGLLMNRG